MKVGVRRREYADGSAVWTCDIHVVPAGESTPERFRLVAPDGVTSRSGAQRWAMDTARRIAVDGRPHQTRKAREVREAQAELVRQQYVPTLREVWPLYVEHLETERRAPGTIATYEVAARLHILPLLGDRRADQVTELDVQRLKTALKGRAIPTINGSLNVLAGLLRVGKLHHPQVVSPPIRGFRHPRPEHLRFYSLADSEALVAAVHDAPVRQAAILLALDCGLRRNEVAALQWADVELRHVVVRHTLWRGKTKPPKGKRSRRIPMTPRLAALLRDLSRDNPWVLPRVGSLGNPTSLTAHITRAAKLAGVPNHGAHSLRHTYATLMIVAGVDIRTLQAYLGHADASQTALYLHLLPEAEAGAVDKLDALRASLRTVTPLARMAPKSGGGGE